jgi:peptidoglycan/LPS O-acetylase OafA/YrhL
MRMPGLDLLRAIAIAWVMLFHSFLVGGLGERWEWLSRYGWMGVDLFFVLSGFLIGQQLLAPLARGEALSLRDFYLRRAFRILPAFWVVLALYLLWPGFREAPGMEPWWKFALFFVNLDIDYLANAAFSHAWSLCVEEHFYLLFPLLGWALAGRVKLRHVVVLALAIVAGGIALRSAVWLHDTAAAPERNWFVEDIYYPTWCRLDGLLAGVLLAALKVHRPLQWEWLTVRANAVTVAGIAVLAAALWLFRERTGLLGNAVGWPVLSLALALLVCAGASRHGVIGRWRVPGAAWLAAISYSLYLVHKPVYHLVSSAWGEALAGRGFWAFVVYAIAAVAGGATLHYLVERPGLALRRRWMARGRTSSTATVPG